MAFDPATGGMALFGGNGETWIYNGLTWAEQSTSVSPDARDLASLAFDPATGKMVLFGGATGEPGRETWTYSPVVKQATQLPSTASKLYVIGGKVSDSASLKGGSDPTGTITFKLYGPSDPNCTAAPVYASPALTVTGDGSYDSEEYEPTEAGAYHWIASYSGDNNNSAAGGICGEASETVFPAQASPVLTITASGSSRLGPGSNMGFTVTLLGGYRPTGKIVIAMYFPSDPGCTGQPNDFEVDVDKNGTFPRIEYAPFEVGTYRFVASYTGDVNNEPTQGTCAAAATVTVGKATPSLSSTASPPVAVGGAIHDSAALEGVEEGESGVRA